MELKIKDYQLPDKISFNFEELKSELEAKVSVYSTMVYTEDQIREAKADKANLNKLKKALNDERIRREREYMIPFNAFKDQVNEIISIIDKPVLLIDKQVKAYEDKQKQEKMEQIKSLWDEMDVPVGLTLDKVFEDRMLNVSYGMNHVKQKMLDDIKRFNRDIETLSALPEFGFEATEVYKSTLDINKAIAEGHRLSEIAKKKAEHEAEQERLRKEAEFAKNMNPPVEKFAEEEVVQNVEPAKTWVKFAALMTVEQARELKRFFDERSIEFKAV